MPPTNHASLNFPVFEASDHQVVAVLVKASDKRPHFAGTAYVRVGSESIKAPEEVFDEMIASKTHECEIRGCNAQFVQLSEISSRTYISEPLEKITISYDESKWLLLLIVD